MKWVLIFVFMGWTNSPAEKPLISFDSLKECQVNLAAYVRVTSPYTGTYICREVKK